MRKQSTKGDAMSKATDDTRADEHLPELQDFHQAVFDDETMTPEMKLHWLKVCADDYLAKMRQAERATNILRGAMGVIQGCAKDRPENLASDVPLVCGVALRATAPKLGVDVHKAAAAERDEQAPQVASAPAPSY
jgi:hypothetical protein